MGKVSVVIKNPTKDNRSEEYGSVEIDEGEKEAFLKNAEKNGTSVRVQGE